MNKPKSINPVCSLTDLELLAAYSGSLLLTIPETREKDEQITIEEATKDYYVLVDEILRRMNAVDVMLDKIRAEIEKQEGWLWKAGYTEHNADIAFDAIRAVILRRMKGGD